MLIHIISYIIFIYHINVIIVNKNVFIINYSERKKSSVINRDYAGFFANSVPLRKLTKAIFYFQIDKYDRI